MRKLPKVHAQIRWLHFEYNVHNMESSLPLFYFKHKYVQKSILLQEDWDWQQTNGWAHVKENHKNRLNQTMCERHEKAYYKTSINMSIKHQHSLQWWIVLSMTSQHTRYRKDIKSVGIISHLYKFLSGQHHEDIYPQRNMYTQNRY